MDVSVLGNTYSGVSGEIWGFWGFSGDLGFLRRFGVSLGII